MFHVKHPLLLDCPHAGRRPENWGLSPFLGLELDFAALIASR